MKIKYIFSLFILSCCLSFVAEAQQYKVMDGDTFNRTDALGRKQGVWREKYPEGTLKSEITYKDGKKNGLELIFWRVPNCIKQETQYKNDTLNGYRIKYFRGCKIKFLETFVEGIRNGYVRKYHHNGELMAEGLYKDGTLQGFIKKYDDKGNQKDKPTLPERKIDLEGYVAEEISIEDSAILKSLTQFSLTKKTVVVTDVTGSMYPYVGQLLLWYKINNSNSPIDRFVFFNDGDDKPDLTKRIGKTGGIYFSSPKQVIDLKKTMELAITKGNGGDPQENDLEAIVESVKKYKKVDQVVLIADRMSPVRDISLLGKIKVPVNVILCGTPDYTNPQYLDIAYKTHGKVYTLDEELKDIHGLHEGQTIHIANLTYVFRSGKFRRIIE